MKASCGGFASRGGRRLYHERMTSQGAGGPHLWGDPEQARQRLKDQIQQAQDFAERAKHARVALEAVSGRASSSRRDITATVDASGRLVDLTFTEQALQRSTQDLAREVLAAVAQAQRVAGAAALEIASEVYGEDSASTSALREEYERMSAPRHSGITYGD